MLIASFPFSGAPLRRLHRLFRAPPFVFHVFFLIIAVDVPLKGSLTVHLLAFLLLPSYRGGARSQKLRHGRCAGIVASNGCQSGANVTHAICTSNCHRIAFHRRDHCWQATWFATHGRQRCFLEGRQGCLAIRFALPAKLAFLSHAILPKLSLRHHLGIGTTPAGDLRGNEVGEETAIFLLRWDSGWRLTRFWRFFQRLHIMLQLTKCGCSTWGQGCSSPQKAEIQRCSSRCQT